MTIPIFDGFDEPIENWSKLPHVFINALPIISTIAEMKVVLYILRHTWGFKEFDMPKRITVDEFVSGRKDKNGNRMDGGTGLTEPSVRAGIEKATEHGFITVFMDDTDKARVIKAYMLKMTDQGEKVLPPEYASGGKSFTPGGKKFLPRSEKETLGKKQEKKETNPPKGKSETNLKIDEVICGYIKGLTTPPAANQYGNPNRTYAKGLVAAGFTPDQVTEYTKIVQKQDYWDGKKPGLRNIADGIAAYFAAKPAGIIPDQPTEIRYSEADDGTPATPEQIAQAKAAFAALVASKNGNDKPIEVNHHE